MKKKFIIVLCTVLPLAAFCHRRSHKKYSVQ